MHQELVLHPAPLTARVKVVVDRRPAVPQPLLERRDYALAQSLTVRCSHRPRRGEGMKPGPVKSLVGVDVSDPGNPRLVEQKRLERSPPPLGYRAQGLRREPVGEGIDPEPGFEEAFELAIANIEVTSGQVYNIGGGAERAISVWWEFKPLLAEAFGRPVEDPAFSDPRPGDQPIFIADTSKAFSDFGWRPRVTPREGVHLLTNWVNANRSLFS